MPLVTTDVVQSTLETNLLNAGLDLEVFIEFPADESQTSEGLYVARLYQEHRQKNSVTLATGGSVYDVIDRLELYLIQGQLNTHMDEFLNIVADFIDNPIYVGYFKREYTVEQLYRKNSECYRIIFSLTRLQVIS